MPSAPAEPASIQPVTPSRSSSRRAFRVASRVRMDVDQAGHDELAARVERRGRLGGERGFDGRDSAGRDADVADGVEPQRRIDDAPAFDDEVVAAGLARRAVLLPRAAPRPRRRTRTRVYSWPCPPMQPCGELSQPAGSRHGSSKREARRSARRPRRLTWPPSLWTNGGDDDEKLGGDSGSGCVCGFGLSRKKRRSRAPTSMTPRSRSTSAPAPTASCACKVTPENGTPREATLTIARRMSENDLARGIADALNTVLGARVRRRQGRRRARQDSQEDARSRQFLGRDHVQRAGLRRHPRQLVASAARREASSSPPAVSSLRAGASRSSRARAATRARSGELRRPGPA